jgi:hypothetical protein
VIGACWCVLQKRVASTSLRVFAGATDGVLVRTETSDEWQPALQETTLFARNLAQGHGLMELFHWLDENEVVRPRVALLLVSLVEYQPAVCCSTNLVIASDRHSHPPITCPAILDLTHTTSCFSSWSTLGAPRAGISDPSAHPLACCSPSERIKRETLLSPHLPGSCS